ncbi:class I SAM-dependent methyltransferase [Crocosphaera chwakensis]|uniref:Thiopurine S-methyltransferase n=1 Tax=Crocosphaera chwakensis CCY0110 TaxID=391612 RepID=A3IZ74_9CHRO|nr:class I SAM-dependent methyltransferase [Crocosphaera chwakensis]EAZ88214.1 Thiopurine S-methyltransferase [Crocosphaera chwakensis CCY0110]
MNEEKLNELRQKVQNLALEYQKKEDFTGWFEVMYTDALGNPEEIPWAKMQPHPCLENWLKTKDITNKKALVIGCGLGDDSELVAEKGANVTAFDIAPSSIEWCKKRFNNSSVNYFVADLLKLDNSWKNSFDLIFESRTIQALPLSIRREVIEAIATLLKPKGTLLVVTRLREIEDIPDGPPWPVSEEELSQLSEYGYEEITRIPYSDPNNPSIKQALIEYQRKRL